MSDTDPFAPADLFPADRYDRAGVSKAGTDRARDRFDALPADQQQAEVDRVASISDGDLIAESKPVHVRASDDETPKPTDLPKRRPGRSRKTADDDA